MFVPLDAALVERGQASRHRAVNPVAAQQLQALERLQAAYAQTLADALQELPTVEDDPIARMATGTREGA